MSLPRIEANQETFDVAIVGMGIVGLSHAYAAARAGRRVIVVDRESQCIGASIRNFGFMTVTGQRRGEMWELARRSRDVWAEVAPQAGIAIDQNGLFLIAQRPEAADVLKEFSQTEMGTDCTLLSEDQCRAQFPKVPFKQFEMALHSPHEIRIEPRLAIPELVHWLADRWGVQFLTGTSVLGVESGVVHTNRGGISAGTCFLCTGDELGGLFPEVLARRNVTRCQLNMLRLRGEGIKLPAPIMSDLSLVRYDGFDALASAAPVREIIDREQPEHRAAGVHLIVVQSADGSLIVGDSHEYAPSPLPFQQAGTDQLILDAFQEVLEWPDPKISERWLGTYAYSPDHPWFSEEVLPGVHMTLVTTGAGMSTAFAIGERVVGQALSIPPKGVDEIMSVQAVIFDWAGTMVDFGSRAPVVAMMRVFEAEGVPVSEALVRRFMGTAKREHVIAMLSDEGTGESWRSKNGRVWCEADVDRIMEHLEPLMRDAATELSDLMPGAMHMLEALRRQSIRIGSSTGYTREMMTGIRASAEAQGYVPDCVRCASDTPRGRPAPFLIWENLIALDVDRVERVVKVDDAPVGIEAGRRAGCWTVGVAGSGNEMGLALAEYLALSAPERSERLSVASEPLVAAGAHFIIETVSDLPMVIDRINAALSRGTVPGVYLPGELYSRSVEDGALDG